MTRCLPALLFMATCGLLACGNDTPAPEQGTAPATACPVGEQRACACLGGTALGVQVCLPSGEGYGACTGCPDLLELSGGVSSGGDPLPSTGGGYATGGNAVPASGATQAVSTGGEIAESGGAPTSGGSVTESGGALGSSGGMLASGGQVPAGGGEAVTGGSLLDIAPAEGAPGVACGVALPVLCTPDAEKCCLRTLQTDSCIDTSAACACELPGCRTTEAYCDGPEDCPDAQVCCGTAGATGYVAFRCQDSCSDARFERIACHMDAPDDGCPAGTICAISQLLSTIHVCIDPITIRQ